MPPLPSLAALLLVGVLAQESTGLAAVAQGGRRATLEPLDISKEPTPADWRYFIKAAEGERERLWTYHTARGTQLGQWAWGWRLGWVRACGQSARAYCLEVLRQGLFDKALVVRAETATRIGRRFEGTGSPEAVDWLVKAYGNPRNLRRGKPLFVQPRILFAIRRVGGAAALAAGERLASVHPDAKAYWARLDSIDNSTQSAAETR